MSRRYAIDSSLIPDRPRQEQLDHELAVAKASRPVIPQPMMVVDRTLRWWPLIWVIIALGIGFCAGLFFAPDFAHADCRITVGGDGKPYTVCDGVVTPTITTEPQIPQQPIYYPAPPSGTICHTTSQLGPDGLYHWVEVCP